MFPCAFTLYISPKCEQSSQQPLERALGHMLGDLSFLKSCKLVPQKIASPAHPCYADSLFQYLLR